MSITRATTQLIKSRDSLKAKIAGNEEKRIKLQGELAVIEKTLQTLGYVDVAAAAGESSSEAEVKMLAHKRL